jgi:hypothetical protein
MKKLSAIAYLVAIYSVCFLATTNIAHAEAEKKKVCVMQKDPKTNKEKEVCKDVKQHKKLEGTKVPEKK